MRNGDKQRKNSEMEVEDVAVATLDEMAAPYNPRKISDHDLASLRRSLTTFGAVEPVVANRRSNRIVGGHQRVRAAMEEGIATLPVVWVDLDDNQERLLNLALNRISGEWDDEQLKNVLLQLESEGVELELAGFGAIEIENLKSGLWKGMDAIGPGDLGDYDPNAENVTIRVGGVSLDLKEEVLAAVQSAVERFNLHAAAF